MKIAVLSGKGGTGKTFVSVNLASVLHGSTYVDCDVEAPNGHLFFQPVWLHTRKVTRALPTIDETSCTGCRQCVDFCKFNALARVGEKMLVFEEVCHSCGGCQLVCPQDAITTKVKEIGSIKSGLSLHNEVVTGTMHINEASGVEIISQLLNQVKSKKNVIIDCPPGSACTVKESIKDADVCVLVAEPTTFGLHNLKMVLELVELNDKPVGVVFNKVTEEGNPVRAFCIEQGMPVLSEFSYDRELASSLSRGEVPSRHSKTMRIRFKDLLNRIYILMVNQLYEEVDHETATCT